MNTLSDAASRYPLLGPKLLAPLGMTHSVAQLLERLPASLKSAKVVHVHARAYTAELRQLVQTWSKLANNVKPHSPVRSGMPKHADLAILVPRVEVSPITLALYLLSEIPFAILMPFDLVDQAWSPNLYESAPWETIQILFESAGKINILSSLMVWIVGNIPEFKDTFFQVDLNYSKKWKPCMNNSIIFVNPDFFKPYEYFNFPKPIVEQSNQIVIMKNIYIYIYIFIFM